MFKKLCSIFNRHATNRVAISLIHPDAIMPTRATDAAAGYDLSSVEDIDIAPQEHALVHTGLKIAVPVGYHLEIRPRSGLALKFGIAVLNSPGTIDADYRGEIMVILYNSSKSTFAIKTGDRIAQALLTKNLDIAWDCVETFDATDRGDAGFGSTGR